MREATQLNPAATVAICTLDRREVLEISLAALAEQDATGVEWEILVVDNGSTDGTAQYVEARILTSKIPMRLLVEPQRGLSFARNRAVENARGEILLFIDDDFACGPSWLKAHLSAFDDPGVDGTGGRTIPRPRGVVPAWLPPDLDAPELAGLVARYDFGPDAADVLEGSSSPDIPFGCNMGVRTAIARRLGGFRVDLGWGRERIPGEETEFFRRVRRHHGRLRYVPDGVGEHHIDVSRLTVARFEQYHYGVGRSRVRMTPPASRLRALVRFVRECGKALSRTAKARTSGRRSLRLRAACARYRGQARECLHQARIGPAGRTIVPGES